jgi:hypothetical protein
MRLARVGRSWRRRFRSRRCPVIADRLELEQVPHLQFLVERREDTAEISGRMKMWHQPSRSLRFRTITAIRLAGYVVRTACRKHISQNHMRRPKRRSIVLGAISRALHPLSLRVSDHRYSTHTSNKFALGNHFLVGLDHRRAGRRQCVRAGCDQKSGRNDLYSHFDMLSLDAETNK